ncbi:MAG TPA: hypothetical protein VN836_08815 [Verrucomicrobiae bacterium]|nr:hypothetical protein [Verrucomicrobiae bacterium]
MPTVVLLWVWFCAYLNCAGWALSAIHELNARGYAVALLIWLIGVVVWRKRTSAQFLPRVRWRKIRRRFRRPLPALFLIVAGLAFLGGALYPPNNFDALTYRLPRMLNWLAAGKWVWISTLNQRMDYSTTGWEWVAMPLLLLLRSDRALFLINVLSFLLLPGLLFSIFRRLGVARRVAWTWMWVLPLGYGYATQAGSIGNDMAGALFCLASVHYGLRARQSGRAEDVWLAGLSAALMTAGKLSNLPLLLPCLFAVWPVLGRLRERWVGSVVVSGCAVLASAVPIMALNQVNTGCWYGDPQNISQIKAQSPPGAFLGNTVLLFQQSFMPPVLPEAHAVDDWLNTRALGSWHRTLEEKFPRYDLNHLNELPQEETAGLGLGITMLLALSVGAAVCGFGRTASNRSLASLMPLVGLGAWMSFLFYMFKMGSEATARLLLPYYPLVIVPVLLLPVQRRLLLCRGWRMLVVFLSLGVLPVIILSPARPLWPASSTSARLARHSPDSPLARRLATVYSAYAQRNDLLAPLRAQLPDDTRTIGFVAELNDADYSLWRPFFLRRVEYLQDGVHPSLRVPGDLEWLVVKQATWRKVSGQPLEEWAAQHRAQIVESVSILTLVSKGPETWSLVRLADTR